MYCCVSGQVVLGVFNAGSAFIVRVKQCFLLDFVILEMKELWSLEMLGVTVPVAIPQPRKILSSRCCDDPKRHGMAVLVVVYMKRP